MLLAKINEKPEIFYTFQGEGINIGKPVIFVRFATCNLHCSFCDTPYTWLWKGTPWRHDKKKRYNLKEQSLAMTSGELGASMIEISKKHKCDRFTITGGEPLLQQREFLEVMNILSVDYKFQYDFETNGTILPAKELLESENVYFNCSPKLANSNNEKKIRYKKEVLEVLNSIPRSSFKFVVDQPKDLEEIQEIQREVGILNEKIYLMPQGVTKKGIADKEEWLAEICKDSGYNLTTRLHVLVYGGAKRGV